jgi:hypothetical protein
MAGLAPTILLHGLNAARRRGNDVAAHQPQRAGVFSGRPTEPAGADRCGLKSPAMARNGLRGRGRNAIDHGL